MVLSEATSPDRYELTILMPCLDEAETVTVCVEKAVRFLTRNGISGEVIVADNGSTDGSRELASAAGARVVAITERGYGAALRGGIAAAQSDYIIMGDADDSYDFSSLEGMLTQLRNGSDLVMGNRFAGGIERGAMPFLHRYLGNPVLSFLGRLFYRNNIGDFHCGLRGFNTASIRALELNSNGMEFASEMVVKSALRKLRIVEVPIRLHPDGRSRPPHLRTWRDGWRHLRFLLLYSPRWLFLLPGLALLITGLATMLAIGIHPVLIGRIGLDIHTLAYAGAIILLGFQMILFAVFTKALGIRGGWLPDDPKSLRWLSHLTLERGLVAAALLFAVGIGMSLHAVTLWAEAGYQALNPRVTMRWVVPSVTALAISGELILGAFFIEALRLPWHPDRKPPHSP